MRKQFSIGFITILTVVVSGKKPTLFGFDLNEDMTKRSHYYIKNWPIAEDMILCKNTKLLKIY